MDGGAWWAAVHGVPKSRTQLNDFTFTFHFHALEKEMANHSSTLAWKIPWTQSTGSLEFPLDIWPGVGLLDHIVTLFLVSKEPPYCFP